MDNGVQIIETGCILGLLCACVVCGYLWLVN